MKGRELTESQIENLMELVNELQGKLKKKNLQLTALRDRLNNAKRTIKRLQGIVTYQRDRILKFYDADVIDKEHLHL
jgi:predicted  nucleic acid-binding Zn-ribbon protein